MKTKSVACLTLLLLLTWGVHSAYAGEPAPELLPETLRKTASQGPAETKLADWTRVQDLLPGTELRVSLERARVLKGKLVSVTDDALIIVPTWKRRETVSASEVVRIHRIHRDSLANGTLIGLGVGAAVGAIFGAATAGGDLSGPAAAGILGLLGAGIGAATGVTTDYHRVKLELIYEKQ